MRRIASCLALCGALAFAGAAAASSIEIVSPRDQETVHDNSGRVAVRVSVQSETLRQGSLAVLLDGHRYGEPQRSRSFKLQGVERGEHQLRVVLLDESGREVAASQPVTFNMWRASALFPNRKK